MRRERRRFASRFDSGDAHDPITSLGNLVDVMLVVACGLAAALVAAGQTDPARTTRDPRGEIARELVRGREVPLPPAAQGRGSDGYTPVGRVFRDPRTGSLVLVDDSNESPSRSTP